MNDPAATPPSSAVRWDPKRAAAWKKWFPVIERGAQVLSDRMVELAAIGPGDRVLDVATGLGEPAVTAARKVGPGGHVEGIDLSAEMLNFARARVRELGHGNIVFREGDATALAVPPETFDCVLCRWGLMFMGDIAVPLRGFHAALKPGGRLVAAVWGPADTAPALALSARVVLAHLDMPPPDEGAGTPFGLADVAALQAQFQAAGFHDVRGEWVPIHFTFQSCEEYARMRRERSVPLEARIAHFPSARRDAAWRAVAQAAQAYTDADGIVRMENAAFCVSARR
jgi:SAM-dependent methyltransferase